MSKKKLTNKELTAAIDGLSQNDQVLWKEILEMKQTFALYLNHKNETDSFSNFVKAKVEEFEKQRSENKKGA